MKTYSGQSGYVYQYYFDGYRAYREAHEQGREFVFTVSADRKMWHAVSVHLHDDAVAQWESAHARTLSGNERYAVAKLALFQAFDDRATPALMKEPVHVRAADVESIIETLGL